jgi:hypothetical protein
MKLEIQEREPVSLAAEAASVNAVPTCPADYHSATVLAFVLCGLLVLMSLLVPPSLSHDAGWGMREWQTYKAGGPINSIISPDAADISRDQVSHVTWWSPGQYLVPGILTLPGIRLGAALSITAGVSLLCCLLGWIQVAKHFALSPRTAALAVAFIATFRYSTLPFGIYTGGEILLQGLTPWLILVGCCVPSLSVFRAAGLAFLAILLAFFAKLTGLMVASAALFAGAVEALVRLRRITAGMVAGAVGATLAFGALYVVWFSRGTTPASGAGWSFRVGDVLFALGSPWGAGVSWTDMLTSLQFNLQRPALGGPEIGNLFLILWLLLPPIVLFVTVIVKGWQRCTRDANLASLLVITACFYAVCALAMSAIFAHGGDVSLEERHLRAAGMLILVCVLAAASFLPQRSAPRLAVGALCVFMSLFGFSAVAYRAWSVKRAQIDHYSGTRQPSVDKGAIDLLTNAFAREGRDALFVLPSPEVASAFPPSARILSNHIEFEPEATISARTYRGKARGRLYVVMPTRIAQSVKGSLLLKEFIDYPSDAWQQQSFGSSTVFVQQGTGTLN